MLIYDMGGRVVYEVQLSENSKSITWSGEKFNSGIYQVIFKSNGLNIAGKKLLLTK